MLCGKVQDLNTAKEIWARLSELNDHKTLSNKIFLKQKLFGLQVDQSKSLEDNIIHFKLINAQLSNLDKKIDEEDQTIILLNAYQNLVVS